MPKQVADPRLLDAERKLRLLIDGVGSHTLLTLDTNGIVVGWNVGAQNTEAYTADEAIGRHFSCFYTQEDIASGKPGQELRIAAESGRFEDSGVRVRKDGSRFSANVIIMPILNERAEIVGFGEVTHDITDRKRINEQLVQAQKMELVGQLSGGIAHDFNNLLTVIIGNADLLIDGLKARPDLCELCAMIVTAGERGAELTQRLLAFGRRQTLQPVAIDCNRQIGGMQQLLRRTLREDIDIHVTLDPLLKAALIDPAQLESVILNLALNAQDAMPGGGFLTIVTTNAVLDEHYRDNSQEVKPGEYVLISVTDDGQGMPLDVRDRAFEPFFTTKEIGKGSGLGLSMVYGFVKQSHGHVSLYSELGFGTTVRLYFPSASSVASKIPNPQPAIGRSLPGGSETVLVAEDDAFVLSYAVRCLKSLGYRVITAVDAGEALARLRQGAEADILFTDIVMPGSINGWELAEQAREIRPGLKVLLTSGYALEALTERARLRANAVILRKPYRKSELAERLRETLDAAV